MCESRLISPYQGCIVLKWFTLSLFLILRFILFLVFFYLCLCRVTLYDYQALCWVYSESSDSGRTLLDVSPANVLKLFSLFVCNPCDAKLGLHVSCYLCLISVFFSLALLRFLLSCEVDSDWACHVRLLCMWECLMSVSNNISLLHVCPF